MSWSELVAAASAIHAAAAAREPAVSGAVLAGIGWATVEGERAIRELDELLGTEAAAEGAAARDDVPWQPAARDELLGASAWIRVAPGNPSTMLLVLEPDTEGRLAASLARWGEGVLAVYVRPPTAADLEPPARPGTAAGSGPLGGGRLVAGGPAWGPHVVVLDPPSR
jgi:hypothetical protein